MELKIVKDEAPNFTEALAAAYDTACAGEMNSLVLVYTVGDKVYTEYVKGDGTTITEMIGAVEIARTELVDAMRR